MKEAYTARSSELLRAAVRKFFVYASGLHDWERFELFKYSQINFLDRKAFTHLFLRQVTAHLPTEVEHICGKFENALSR